MQEINHVDVLSITIFGKPRKNARTMWVEKNDLILARPHSWFHTSDVYQSKVTVLHYSSTLAALVNRREAQEREE